MNSKILLTTYTLNNQELLKLIRKLKCLYPYFFKKLNKQELRDYVNMFYGFYHEYDYDILNKMIDKCFDFKMKYMPTFAELNNYLEDALIGRIFEIVNIMHDKGFYRIGATGTPDEISHKEFLAYDKVLEELINHNLHKAHREEIINYINDNIDMEKYKHIYLFEGIFC